MAEGRRQGYGLASPADRRAEQQQQQLGGGSGSKVRARARDGAE